MKPNIQIDEYTSRTGQLSVGQGHEVYWQVWGKPSAPLIFHLHGGPGSGCRNEHKLLYDPKRHCVVFHDQRGCGGSHPVGNIETNRTPNLIADIEKIREELKVDSIYVSGGSWGSTLGLAYAIMHPERVKRMVLWSIYLARPFDDNLVNSGYFRYSFPEAWERFIGEVPVEFRETGEEVMRYYARQINSSDAVIAQRYANEWVLWESTLSSFDYDKRKLENELVGGENDQQNLALAKIETHYFQNGCFIGEIVKEGTLLDGIERIRHIPCTAIQGRFDMCTPPIGALDLAGRYGQNLDLHLVNSGHSGPELAAVRRTVIATNFV